LVPAGSTFNLGVVAADDIIGVDVHNLAMIKPELEIADVGLEMKVMAKGIKRVMCLCIT
jgi:hypothetical protein